MITGPIPDLSGLIDLRECFYIFTVHLLYRLCDLTVIWMLPFFYWTLIGELILGNNAYPATQADANLGVDASPAGLGITGPIPESLLNLSKLSKFGWKLF